MSSHIKILLSALVLSALLFSARALAQEGTGSTLIDVTIPGYLTLNLSYPEIVIAENYYFYENLSALEIDSSDIWIYLNKSDTNNFVKFVNITGGGSYYQDDYTMYLPSNSAQNVTLRIYVPTGMGYNGGTYNIPLYAYSLSDYRTNTTTLKIHVDNTNPIDDIMIKSINPSSLYQGQSLTADVAIHKLAPAEMTDIQICYCINPSTGYACGPSYNNYGCEWKAITTWLNYSKTVVVSESPGDYYFIIAVKYPGDENIKRANSAQFHVLSTPVTPPSGPSGGAPSFGGTAARPQPSFSIVSPDYIDSMPGMTVAFSAGVRNTGSATAVNTTFGVYGVPENWARVTPSVQDIAVNQSKNYSVTITIPHDAFEQIYSVSLVAKSGISEGMKVTTLTVASTPMKNAKFLLDEARSRKEYAGIVLDKVVEFGMSTEDVDINFTEANEILLVAQEFFDKGFYPNSIEKSKEAIDKYKAVIASAKLVVGQGYLSLLEDIQESMPKARLSGEYGLMKSIEEKVSESDILYREDRMIEAYENLLDAKHLIDQLIGKMDMFELLRAILIASVFAVILVVVLALVFYFKKVSWFMRTLRMEDQKKHLKHVFDKEVRPSPTHAEMPRREHTAKHHRIDAEHGKLAEITALLEKGSELLRSDPEAAREAYTTAKKIYGTLLDDEKRFIDGEIKKFMKLRDEAEKERKA